MPAVPPHADEVLQFVRRDHRRVSEHQCYTVPAPSGRRASRARRGPGGGGHRGHAGRSPGVGGRGPTSGHLPGNPAESSTAATVFPVSHAGLRLMTRLSCRPQAAMFYWTALRAQLHGPRPRSCPALPGGTSQTVTVASGEADAIHISASQHEPSSPAGQVVARTPPPSGLRRAAAAPSAQPGPG